MIHVLVVFIARHGSEMRNAGIMHERDLVPTLLLLRSVFFFFFFFFFSFHDPRTRHLAHDLHPPAIPRADPRAELLPVPHVLRLLPRTEGDEVEHADGMRPQMRRQRGDEGGQLGRQLQIPRRRGAPRRRRRREVGDLRGRTQQQQRRVQRRVVRQQLGRRPDLGRPLGRHRRRAQRRADPRPPRQHQQQVPAHVPRQQMTRRQLRRQNHPPEHAGLHERREPGGAQRGEEGGRRGAGFEGDEVDAAEDHFLSLLFCSLGGGGGGGCGALDGGGCV